MGKDGEVKDVRLAKTNLFLLLSNALVLAGLVYAGVLAVQSFDRAEATFLRMAQLEGDPNPCALPSPDVYFLFQALDLAPTSAVHAVKRNAWVANIENALCHAEFGSTSSVGSDSAEYDYAKRLTTLASLFNNRTLRPPENFDDYATAVGQKAADHPWAPVGERLLTEYLCTLTHNHSVAGAEYDNFNSKLYGDLVYRVSRAYLNAMPAFYKLATSGKWPTDLGQSTGADVYDRTCMEQHHPFRSDIAPTDCAWIGTIRRELAAAGTAAQSALMVGQHTKLTPATSVPANPDATADSPEYDVGGYYAASMPRVDAMLYRLLALTVVGHYDRTRNNRDCFRNHAPATDGAADMCRDLYAAANQNGLDAFPDAADVQLPALGSEDHPLKSGQGANAVTKFSSYQLRMATMIPRSQRYGDGEPIAQAEPRYNTGHYKFEAAAADDTAVYGGDARPQARTCSMHERDYVRYSPPSSVPSWEYSIAAAPVGYTGPAGGALDAVIEACAQNMKWGLLEQTRLFGLPDAVHEFVVEPRDVAAHVLRGLYETFLNDYYVNVLADSGGDENKPAYALRLWSGFQFAMTGLWTTMFGSVAGYLTAWAVVPLAAQLLPRLPLIGRALQPCWRKNGAQQTIVRPSIAANPIFIAWTVMAVFVSVWMIGVAPAEGPVYPVDSDCAAFEGSPDERGSNGGVFSTSARDVKAVVTAHSIPGWVLVGLIVWSWVYELVIARCVAKLDPVLDFVKEYKKRNKILDRNFVATLLVIVVSAICIGLAVASAVMQGNNWKDVAGNKQTAIDAPDATADSYAALSPEAEWLAHEVRMCAITSYLQAVGVGMLGQRWVVVNLSSLDITLYYALVGGFLVAPYWVRTTLMADQWTPLFTEADRTDQAALFSIALGVAAVGTGVVFYQCYRVACSTSKGRPQSDDVKAAALRVDPEADVAGEQKAAEQAAAQKSEAKIDEKQSEAASEWQRLREESMPSMPSIPGGGVLERGWAGADPRGAYLPMIRIRV